jgi:hypothetical protein
MLLRKLGEDPPYLRNQLDLNLRLRLDLREDPQLMDKYPQPIPRISKVVRPLQAYIRRPSHGEGHGEMERYQAYDLMRSGIGETLKASNL